MKTLSQRRLWPLFALCTCAFIFFWQYFFLNQTLYARDQAFVMLPYGHFVMHRLMEGRLPLWNPYLFGGATLGVGVVLSAAQLFAQWELAKSSDRSTRASFEYATQFSLAPAHFLTATLFPKHYGLFSSAPQDNFYPGEETGYVGMAALVLIGTALVAA